MNYDVLENVYTSILQIATNVVLHFVMYSIAECGVYNANDDMYYIPDTNAPPFDNSNHNILIPNVSKIWVINTHTHESAKRTISAL